MRVSLLQSLLFGVVLAFLSGTAGAMAGGVTEGRKLNKLFIAKSFPEGTTYFLSEHDSQEFTEILKGGRRSKYKGLTGCVSFSSKLCALGLQKQSAFFVMEPAVGTMMLRSGGKTEKLTLPPDVGAQFSRKVKQVMAKRPARSRTFIGDSVLLN